MTKAQRRLIRLHRRALRSWSELQLPPRFVAPPEGFDNSVLDALFLELLKAFRIPPEFLDKDRKP